MLLEEKLLTVKDSLMITFTTKGDFKNTERFLDKIEKQDFYKTIDVYAQRGVEALAASTPKDSGLTASSWTYEIEKTSDSVIINWINTNVNKGVNIAIILQYGHGTRNGGYVYGIDYINPSIRPIFEEMANSIWKEVTA